MVTIADAPIAVPLATKPTTINPAKPAASEIPTLVRVDPFTPANQQAGIHTCWHPDIPAYATIELDKPFKVECMDYSGFQINNDDIADDVLGMDHDSDHHLSGPFWVPGAQPGDVLEIDILDVTEHPAHPWGYCVTYPGLGSLDREDVPTEVTKTIWEFAGEATKSCHVPYVAFEGRAHPGVVGTAPSAALLAQWVEPEAADAVGVTLPLVSGAYVGQEMDKALRQRIYVEGARTGPGREHGGNIDIASLTSGSNVFLPVFVEGAKLSVGDTHFCQSDGEPTTAIEMPGVVTLRVNVVRDGVRTLGLTTPMYQTSPTESTYPNKLVFTGLSTTPDGKQTDRDGLTAYRNASCSAMQYLQKMGYSREHAYVLLSAAPVESKVVATANQPNMVISVGIPMDIFGFDIRPRAMEAPKPNILGPAMLTEHRRSAVEEAREANTRANGTST